MMILRLGDIDLGYFEHDLDARNFGTFVVYGFFFFILVQIVCISIKGISYVQVKIEKLEADKKVNHF